MEDPVPNVGSLGATSGTVVKPTILAFHGSGSNSMIHEVQLARLMRFISSHVNIENLEGPFPCPAGPGVLPFFEGCEPYKSWMPPGKKVGMPDMLAGTSSNTMAPEVEEIVRSAVQRIRSGGGTVVGLIGFSQGTRVVGGLLKASEMRRALEKTDEKTTTTSTTDWLDFHFGISVCASYPPLILPPSITAQLAKSNLSQEEQVALLAEKIRLPAFFAQGKKDEWNGVGQALIDKHYECGEGMGVVCDWNNAHHYPVEPEHTKEISRWLLEALEKSRGEGDRA